MKRILSIILTLFICTGAVFAAEEIEGDEYDDGYVYEQNGKGDQFLKINIGALFPLNFNGQLYTGGVAEIGYYRFFNSWFAVGGELTATYNISIGEKVLVMLPMTAGVLLQPSVGKFEFPVYINAGVSYESWQSKNYFPSFAGKITAGAYYRLNDICSFGITSTGSWIPQWGKDSSKNKNGLFLSASAGARYHF